MMLLKSGARVDIVCNLDKTALELAYLSSNSNHSETFSLDGISWETLKCLHKLLGEDDYVIPKSDSSSSPGTGKIQVFFLPGLLHFQRPFSKLISKMRLSEKEDAPIQENFKEKFLADFDVSHIDWAVPDHFVIAEDILKGDRRHKLFRKPGLNDYIHMTRSIVQVKKGQRASFTFIRVGAKMGTCSSLFPSAYLILETISDLTRCSCSLTMATSIKPKKMGTIRQRRLMRLNTQAQEGQANLILFRATVTESRFLQAAEVFNLQVIVVPLSPLLKAAHFKALSDVSNAILNQ